MFIFSGLGDRSIIRKDHWAVCDLLWKLQESMGYMGEFWDPEVNCCNKYLNMGDWLWHWEVREGWKNSEK